MLDWNAEDVRLAYFGAVHAQIAPGFVAAQQATGESAHQWPGSVE